jgi:hypothetical protein
MVINFDHGALRGRNEPVLDGIMAHAVLPGAAAHAMSFLSAARHIAPADWSRVLERAPDPADDVHQLLAVERLRDAIAETPASAIMLEVNDRIEEISRGHVDVRALLTSAMYGMLLRRTIGERDAARLYAPFESFIPLAWLA